MSENKKIWWLELSRIVLVTVAIITLVAVAIIPQNKPLNNKVVIDAYSNMYLIKQNNFGIIKVIDLNSYDIELLILGDERDYVQP